MDSETKYELAQPFEYSFQGDLQSASFILLKEPNSTHLAEVGRIRKWVNQALRENRAANEDAVDEVLESRDDAIPKIDTDLPEVPDDDDEEIEGGMIVGMMSAADVPLDKFYLNVQAIMSGNQMAFADGQTKMTPVMWKRISAHDMELMIGHFVGVFFLR